MQCDTLQASRLGTRRACNRAKERNYKISVRISASINTVIRRIPERIAYAEGERISGVLGIRKMQVPRQRPFVTETTAAHRGNLLEIRQHAFAPCHASSRSPGWRICAIARASLSHLPVSTANCRLPFAVNA
jgi:hypothetical protein